MNKEILLLIANEDPKYYKDWSLKQVKKLLNWRKKAKRIIKIKVKDNN